MELGQVEAFVEANRRGSISRAAEALGLTQPTCTARLHGLERELGAQLLVRGRRGVSLTPAGRRFLPRAVAALDSLRRGATETKAGSDARGGLLAIGIASDLALYLAPRALARFAARHPQVETLVRSGHSRFVADLLRADEVELALVSQRVMLAGLGAALLPEMAIRSELGRGDLVQVRVEGHPPPKRAIHALTRQGAEPSAAAGALLRLIG